MSEQRMGCLCTPKKSPRNTQAEQTDAAQHFHCRYSPPRKPGRKHQAILHVPPARPIVMWSQGESAALVNCTCGGSLEWHCKTKESPERLLRAQGSAQTGVGFCWRCLSAL